VYCKKSLKKEQVNKMFQKLVLNDDKTNVQLM